MVRVSARGLVLLFVAIAIVFAPSIPVSAAVTTFSVQNIGTLVGTGDGQFDLLDLIVPSSINANGDLVANAVSTEGLFWSVPFTVIDGKLLRIGKERLYSHANDINANGEVAGYVTTLDDLNAEFTRAVVWREREMVELPGLGGNSTIANGISDDGTIVGYADTDDFGNFHAVRWVDGVIEDLGTLGDARSEAKAVSDSGVVIGWSGVPDEPGTFPFVWKNGLMTRLSTPDGRSGEVVAINSDEVIVGWVRHENLRFFYGIRYVNGEPEYLPAFEVGAMSSAADVNSEGAVVGAAQQSANETAEFVAVLWEGDQIFDLNVLVPPDSGVRLRSALSINDAGQILAFGEGGSGVRGGYLLTPVEDAAASLSLAAVPAAIRSRFI